MKMSSGQKTYSLMSQNLAKNGINSSAKIYNSTFFKAGSFAAQLAERPLIYLM